MGSAMFAMFIVKVAEDSQTLLTGAKAFVEPPLLPIKASEVIEHARLNQLIARSS